MIFQKPKSKVDKGMNKIDKLVTGLIIGGAVASIFGLSRTQKGKDITSHAIDGSRGVAKKSYSFFGKFLVKIITFFSPKK